MIKRLLLLAIVGFLFNCKKNNTTATPNTPPATTPTNAKCRFVYTFETECRNSSVGAPMNITSGTLTVRLYSTGFTGTVVSNTGLSYADTVKFNNVLLSAIDTVYTYTQSSNIFNPTRSIVFDASSVDEFDSIPLWKEYMYLPDSLDRNTANGFYVNSISPSFFPFSNTQITITVSDEALPTANTVTLTGVLGTYTAYYPSGALLGLNATSQGAIKVDISEYQLHESPEFTYMTRRIHHYTKKIKLK